MSGSGFYLLPKSKLSKKEKAKRLKNFPAGYVGSFYRNLVDNVDNFAGSDFYSGIATDSDIPNDDVQKYILATLDFAKGIQTDINHYVTRDRINDASFRQKLDPISKNIMRRQNPLELVFEDTSTFDAENPIVRSLLREVDLTKKQTDSVQNPNVDSLLQQRLNNLRGPDLISGSNLPSPPPPPPPFFANNTSNFHIPAQLSSFNRRAGSSQGPGNNLFGSEAATLTRERVKEKTDTQLAIVDIFYELPDNSELELGDAFEYLEMLENLGTTAEDVFQVDKITKEEEEDVILEKIKEEYGFEDTKESMDEVKVPESIYFF